MTNIETVSIMVVGFEISNINTLLLFKYVLYIHYLMLFIKNQTEIQILIDSRHEINAMFLAYIAKL